MFTYVDQLGDQILRYVNHLSPQGWMLVLAIAIPVGLICLRGFGSRSSY